MKEKRDNKIKVRKFWGINPKTRIKKSARIYRRTKKKKELKDILKGFL